MNRTEANAFADGMTELRSLEGLKQLLDDTTLVAVRSSTAVTQLDADHPLYGRHVAAAVAALQSSVANRMIDLKATLGITDAPAPVADEAPATEAPAEAAPSDVPVVDTPAEATPVADTPAAEPPAPEAVAA